MDADHYHDSPAYTELLEAITFERRRHDSAQIRWSCTLEVVLLLELLPRFIQRCENRSANHLLLCGRCRR